MSSLEIMHEVEATKRLQTTLLLRRKSGRKHLCKWILYHSLLSALTSLTLPQNKTKRYAWLGVRQGRRGR